MKSKKVIDGIAGVLHNGGLDAHRNYGFMGKSIGIWNDFRRGFAREIYNNRKEIGLFTLSDIEIDMGKLDLRWDILYDEDIDPIMKWWLNGEEIKVTSFEDLAKAIVDKKPIKIKE